MKRAFRISILVIFLFAVVVTLTAKIERPVDGNDGYGFPLIFLTRYGGKVAGPFRPSDFNFLNLLIDLLPAIILAILLERAGATIVEKVRSKFTTQRDQRVF